MKKIILAHSELTNRIYAIIGREKVDITAQAIAEVKAVEALKGTDGGDCIGRQSVLYGLVSIAKAKAKSDAQKSLMGRVMFFVEQMPSVQPKAKWIPVKEDLPKTADSVLISVNGKIGEINHEHSIMFGSYCSVDGWMIEDVKVDYDKDYFEVEAWQKAPEIYDGREGEE